MFPSKKGQTLIGNGYSKANILQLSQKQANKKILKTTVALMTKEKNPIAFLSYIKGITEKIRQIFKKHNIKTIFKPHNKFTLNKSKKSFKHQEYIT